MAKGWKATPEQRARMGRERTRPDMHCQVCGVTFRPQQNKARSRTGRGDRYCSRKCWVIGASNGPLHANWTGGTWVQRGYRYRWLSPEERQHHTCSLKGGAYIKEHALIAERALGRCLRHGEVVHHVNMDKLDNRNTNLLVCTNSYHRSLHERMGRMWAREHLRGA